MISLVKPVKLEFAEHDFTNLPELGSFGGNPFHLKLRIEGGEEGIYELFFHILVTIHEPPRPF
jgi:hypothetical protein